MRLDDTREVNGLMPFWLLREGKQPGTSCYATLAVGPQHELFRTLITHKSYKFKMCVILYLLCFTLKSRKYISMLKLFHKTQNIETTK